MQGHNKWGYTAQVFSSSRLPTPLCLPMLVAAHLDSLMGRGQDVPVNEKQEPAHLQIACGGDPHGVAAGRLWGS